MRKVEAFGIAWKSQQSHPSPTMKNSQMWGSLGGSAIWHLPSAQGVILEIQDRVLHQAPCMEPASPSACVSAPAPTVSHE